MKLCQVVGRVWPEQQLEGLNGKALVAVRDVHDDQVLVALDLVDAGVGSRVLVVTGEPARAISRHAPVDAVITAIVNADAIAR